MTGGSGRFVSPLESSLPMCARVSEPRRRRSRSRGARLPALALLALVLPAPGGPVLALPTPTDDPPTTERLLADAVQALGGDDALRGLATARSSGRLHSWALEQSERPEGPWIVTYGEFEEWIDIAGGRSRTRAAMVNAQFPQGAEATRIFADGAVAIGRGERLSPGYRTLAIEAEERLVLDPAGVLIAARAASLGKPRRTEYEQVPHWSVPFDWKDGRIVVLLNASTHLPSAVRLYRSYPEDNMLGVWGRIETEVRFHYWELHAGGWRYPHQWQTLRNGQPLRARLVLEVEPAATAPADAFAIPDEVVRQYRESAGPTRLSVAPGDTGDVVEIADGVVLLNGWWNVVLVEQEDGVVVIEGPLSSEYSQKVLQEAGRRFPGKPVKAVINTSDAWPHIGGLRTYAARGVPVWTQPRNAPLLRRLMAARYSDHPDLLERQPRPAAFEWVDHARHIDSSKNSIVVAPIDGEWSDRMLMVYLPDVKLLYGADLVFPPRPGRVGYFMPGYLEELRDAVRREELEVEQLVSMHAGPLPWSDVLEEIERVHAAAAPAR